MSVAAWGRRRGDALGEEIGFRRVSTMQPTSSTARRHGGGRTLHVDEVSARGCDLDDDPLSHERQRAGRRRDARREEEEKERCWEGGRIGGWEREKRERNICVG